MTQQVYRKLEIYLFILEGESEEAIVVTKTTA